jgi:cell division protein FtsI/penicillin-binding protein 2
VPTGRRAAAALAAVALTATGCSLFGKDPKPDPAARAFLDAWGRGDVAAASGATDDSSGAAALLQGIKDSLRPVKGELVAAEPRVDGDHATVPYHAAWTIPGISDPWTYDGRLSMVKQGDAWTVHFEPADLHPQLAAGQRIAARRQLPERAALQDGSGQPLVVPTPVVTVGVEPGKVKDLPQLAGQLAAALKISAADIVKDVSAARPTDFVTVITLRRPAYEAVRARIHDLPGTVFREGTQQLGPSTGFAQPLLGTVGPATAEVLKEAGNGYLPTDQLGRSGLQRAFNTQLAGAAGAKIVSIDGKGGDVTQLGVIAGHPGTPVRTTLDVRTQTAADAAIAGVPQAAAIVAVRVSNGELLAVANNAVAPYDIALAGRYPAGSTFKTITATALLTHRVVTPESTVDCPATTVVYGKQFQNENKFDLGKIPLREAFAHSCNTTFTGLTQQLDFGALSDAAGQYGLGAEWKLPVDSFSGSVPTPKDDAEKAADAIGQGRVEVSPLALALVAAGVKRGAVVAPALVHGIAAAPKDGSKPEGPPITVMPAVRDMMRAVVTEGTAKDLATLPGAPVSGKTGTAEYGTDVPPRSHAWFIGYRDDLAFAVFVQDGQSSHTTAVPIARTFLAALG